MSTEPLKPNLDSKNPFEILGFNDASKYADLSDKDIKNQYRRLASKFHPDKVANQSDQGALEKAAEQFKKVQFAFDKLKTQTQRESIISPGFSNRNTQGANRNNNSSSRTNSSSHGTGNEDFNQKANSSTHSKGNQNYNKQESHTGSKRTGGFNWENYDFDGKYKEWEKTWEEKKSHKLDELLKGARAEGKRPQLSSMDVFKVDLSGKDLTNVDFEGFISGVNFSEADLTGASFKDCSMYSNTFSNTILDTVDFTNASFSSETLKDLTFKNSKFSAEAFNYTKLSNITFEDSSLKGVDFRKVDSLENIKFTGSTTLEGAIFTTKQLEGLSLSGSQRSGVLYSEHAYSASAKEAKFTPEGKLKMSWADAIKSEKMNPRKGIAFAAGAAAVAGAFYLANKWDDKLKAEQNNQSLHNQR